jgi:hypothetical protein
MKWLVLIAFLLILPMINATECTDAGYICEDAHCGWYQEQVDLDCNSPPAGRPLFCCKEKAGPDTSLNIAPDVLDMDEVVSLHINLPYFADCNYTITSPQKVSRFAGSGGCGPTGVAYSFGKSSIEDQFGELTTGIWTVEVLANKPGYPDIVLEDTFVVPIAEEYVKTQCTINDGAGTCEFLGETYQLQANGCNEQVDVRIVYDDEVDNLLDVRQGSDFFVLSNDVEIQLSGSPCGKALHAFTFRSALETSCGNNICEVGEESGCSADCANLEVAPEPSSSTTCSVGCAYGTSCVAVGTRKDDSYCSSSMFVQQKQNGDGCDESYECLSNTCKNGVCRPICEGCMIENVCVPVGTRLESSFCSSNYVREAQHADATACVNNYECGSNVCVDSQCVPQGMFQKFLKWLSTIF